MEYIILYASSAEELIKEVNTYIKLGWRPQGGVAITSTTWQYAQAMVRD
jgi:Domain of unknown function (DUF1737)